MVSIEYLHLPIREPFLQFLGGLSKSSGQGEYTIVQENVGQLVNYLLRDSRFKDAANDGCDGDGLSILASAWWGCFLSRLTMVQRQLKVHNENLCNFWFVSLKGPPG